MIQARGFCFRADGWLGPSRARNPYGPAIKMAWPVYASIMKFRDFLFPRSLAQKHGADVALRIAQGRDRHNRERQARAAMRQVELATKLNAGLYGPLRWGLAAAIARHEGIPVRTVRKDLEAILGRVLFPNHSQGGFNRANRRRGLPVEDPRPRLRERLRNTRGLFACHSWEPVPGGIQPPTDPVLIRAEEKRRARIQAQIKQTEKQLRLPDK